MASVEQRAPVKTNGGSKTNTIPVENPATGELITTIPVLGAAELKEMAIRARDAQPAWEAAGFEEYTKIQSLLITRRALKREPFMFPYRARRTMLLRKLFNVLYGRGRRD
ncbi:MAG TPA: aldehyde dehydrogenase family protein [Solirubrobacteraceae bacterium]|nr:aldehyde dehydrogenase family protein [Solirubrobacteraceae bacterium]